jgi:hypothetical protein
MFTTEQEARAYLAETFGTDDERDIRPHIRFEYDLDYAGGNYSKVGDFAYVPAELCLRLGDEEAFEQHTGIDRIHIASYCPDELYDEDGNEWEEG